MYCTGINEVEEKLVKFGIYREMCGGSLYQFVNEPEKSKPEHGCGEVKLFELSSNRFNYWELMIFYSYRIVYCIFCAGMVFSLPTSHIRSAVIFHPLPLP